MVSKKYNFYAYAAGSYPPEGTQSSIIPVQGCKIQLIVAQQLRNCEFHGGEICCKLELAAFSQRMHNRSMQNEAMQGVPTEIRHPAR